MSKESDDAEKEFLAALPARSSVALWNSGVWRILNVTFIDACPCQGSHVRKLKPCMLKSFL